LKRLKLIQTVFVLVSSIKVDREIGGSKSAYKAQRVWDITIGPVEKRIASLRRNDMNRVATFLTSSIFRKAVAPVLVIGLGMGSFALLHAAKPEPEKKEEIPRPLSVFVKEVQRQDVSLEVMTGGEVRPRTEVNIVSQVGGRIVDVSREFTEGGRVSPGAVLITIEDTDYQLAVSQTEARVAEAEVGVQQAMADADVARKQLRNSKDASPLALKKPQVAQAQASLKGAEAAHQQAKLNLSRTKISLPFNGRISQKMVDVGQYVGPGSTLAVAFSTDRVEVRIPLSDSQLESLDLPIGYISEDGGRDVDFNAVVAGHEHHWAGKLVRLDASVDTNTRMLYGIAEVEDPYGANVSVHGMPMAVGLYVNAQIEGKKVASAHVIPRSALRAGDTVYLVNSEGFLEVRQVDVTHSTDTEAVIKNGLVEGELVIVSSIRNPIAGMALEALESGEDGEIIVRATSVKKPIAELAANTDAADASAEGE